MDCQPPTVWFMWRLGLKGNALRTIEVMDRKIRIIAVRVTSFRIIVEVFTLKIRFVEVKFRFQNRRIHFLFHVQIQRVFLGRQK